MKSNTTRALNRGASMVDVRWLLAVSEVNFSVLVELVIEILKQLPEKDQPWAGGRGVGVKHQ